MTRLEGFSYRAAPLIVALGVLLAAGGSRHASANGVLADLAGDFLLTSKFWTPGASSPEVVTLSARRAPALSGRVLRIDVGSEDGGFQGTGLMGRDERTGEFWYVWTDTSSTGRSILRGHLGPDGTGSLTGETPTPAGYAPLEVVIRMDGDREIHEYYEPAGDGARRRWLELTYERRAAVPSE